MSKKVFIHVGFHKTGTSAIQQSLSKRRKKLKSLGVTYPGSKYRAHHRAAWALTGRYWGWKNRGGKKSPIKNWRNLLLTIKFARGTSIISSEFFSELQKAEVARVKRDFKGSDTQIIFTLRPLVKMLSSSYQQYVKYGLTATYDEWLDDIFAADKKSKLSPTFWKRHNHPNVIGRWVNEFGKENVHVIIVDEKQPDFLYDSFNNLLGLPPKTLKEGTQKGSNRSLTYPEVSLILAINQAYPKDRQWDDYQMFIRNGAVKHLTDKVKPTPGEAKLNTPQWAVDKSLEITKATISRLREMGVHIHGDIDNMLSAEVPVGSNPELAAIPIATAANILLAHKKSRIIKRFTSREIFTEALKRVARVVKKS